MAVCWVALSCAGGGGGSASTDGGAADAGVADAGDLAHLCDVAQAKLWGTIDGVPVDATYPGKGFGIYAYGGADVHASFGTDGSFVALRSSAYDREEPVRFALVQFPRDGVFAEQVYCAGDSSAIAHERRPITFKLRNLVRRSTKKTDVPDAGPCEGTPVAGELDGCVGPAN